jgi:hypothetical protein
MDAHVMSMVFFDTVEMQRSTMKSVWERWTLCISELFVATVLF